MTDYTKLVEALRYCGNFTEREGCDESCEYFNDMDCPNRIMSDAAAAIEELQDKVVELEEELNDADVAADDNGRQVEELQAEIERLKDSNEELRERQTYIDHYGDRWMTSAKDVPTAAYKHGYADGRDEAEAQLPKRGEFEKSLHEMFDSIWDCDINHPIFQDTVGELMEAVLQAYDTVNRAKMEVQE